MMKIFSNPTELEIRELVKRPALDKASLESVIASVFDDVEKRGDEALRDYTKKFDGVELTNLVVSKEEVEALANTVPKELCSAIDQAYENIQKFHKEQIVEVARIETMPGVSCWRENRAINRVGLYIPGGTAPLVSTVLMLGVPAQIAGCKDIVLTTPPSSGSRVSPAICYAALKVGVNEIVTVGGAQAVAGMALGTNTIMKVDKIFGPGNQYVTEAKMWAQKRGTAIDMPAGPSEVLVIADESAEVRYVAADLLSQAEHGTDSQVVLVALSDSVAKNVIQEVAIQCKVLPRSDVAKEALGNSFALVVNNINEAIEFSNQYAPEHLILSVDSPEDIAQKVESAGSVFLGNYSPESAGDYASGTNHSLPTNGWSTSYSGVSLDSFVKKITFQNISKQGLDLLAPSVIALAEAEGLEAHANAVKVRL